MINLSYVRRAHTKQLVANIPPFVHGSIQFEVIMGSFAYGVNDDTSDIDIYGFCVPPKNVVFPHLSGKYIFNYDTHVSRNFEQWQCHHVADKDARKEYDFCIYNISKYFRLCIDGNPNMIDSLFVPIRCVTHSTAIGNLVRERRYDFLSQKCWHSFKGYAYSQLHKMDIKNPEGKRKKTIEKYGYDVKFAYHVVRLLNEIEQILIEGDLDLERNREQLKSIRRGKWKVQEIRQYFQDKEKYLEELVVKTKLPYAPEYDKIRNLLFECLSIHFSEDVRPAVNKYDDLLNDLEMVLGKYRKG
jgi:predicted nucleotidyltransferase